MVLNSGSNSKDIGVEDDVLGRETDADEQVIGALAYLDLALLGVGLPHFVEGHDHHSCAIGHAFASLLEEWLFALFHTDRVDDGLAADAFEPCFDHVPF